MGGLGLFHLTRLRILGRHGGSVASPFDETKNGEGNHQEKQSMWCNFGESASPNEIPQLLSKAPFSCYELE